MIVAQSQRPSITSQQGVRDNGTGGSFTLSACEREESMSNHGAEDPELEEFLHDFVIQDLIALSLNLELLVGRAQSLIHRLRDVVDKRGEDRSLEHVISIASASFDGFANCAIHVHPASNMLLDKDLLLDVSCVIRESVSNAVRHGNASQVSINAVTLGDLIELIVDDDGVGVDEGAVGRGNGTRNMAKRAMRRGGSCSITRRQEGGTRVTWKARTKEQRHD